MQQDYKHRATSANQGGTKRKPRKRNSTARKAKSAAREPNKVPIWRWGLVFGLIALFIYFLYQLPKATKKERPIQRVTKPLDPIKKIPAKKVPVKAKPVKVIKPKDEIQYDFYTILPEAEYVVPDYEVKTRKREERVGKAKAGVRYSIQAGAFRQYKEADSLKAKLLMMGFLPKIEKAVVGSATWYRVKMGPYNRLASVDAIQSRLKANKMDALVIEVKK